MCPLLHQPPLALQRAKDTQTLKPSERLAALHAELLQVQHSLDSDRLPLSCLCLVPSKRVSVDAPPSQYPNRVWAGCLS